MRASLAGPLTALGMIALLLSLPVSLPLGLILGAWQDRRQRSVAERTCCARCGHPLGAAAIQAADAAHIAELGTMQRQYPNCRVHIVRRADARCTQCGATYAWDRRQHLLRPLEDGASSGP